MTLASCVELGTGSSLGKDRHTPRLSDADASAIKIYLSQTFLAFPIDLFQSSHCPCLPHPLLTNARRLLQEPDSLPDMPVSHIGLTVSHLPTSCSFFLAALTPLGYRYIGQFDGQIGFGVDEPEFFISQETTTYVTRRKS